MTTILDKILNKFSLGKITLTINFILWILLLITGIAIFVPLSPGMPASGLDPSWQFGTNQAVAQGLSFGKAMIFTSGPYASIYTRSYHPSTDFMAISGSLYLALSYWIYLILLMKDARWQWILAFCVVLAALMYLLDTLFFSLPLIVGLIIFKSQLSNESRLLKSKFSSIYIAILFAPLGFIPLIKGSLFILCIAVVILCSIYFICNKNRIFAAICVISPIISMLFFWIASGQSVANLLNYLISMTVIAAGYTEAMAINGNVTEIILYLIASSFLLIVISIQKKISNISKIFLFCIYFVFLFISFKGGFVRHDGHAIISGTSILIAALLLLFIINSRLTIPVVVFGLISWFYIDSHYIKTSPVGILNNLVSTYSSAWRGIKNRLESQDRLRLEFEKAVNTLRGQASFPVLKGTTDIYSYNQSYLISSGNNWSPRPVIQSYSAYTSALAEANREHLLGLKAPDNIIFGVEPIDGRLPSIEDGASWPILIANYQPNRLTNEFLFLKKSEKISGIIKPVKLLSEQHTFGETVNLPHSSQPIFAQVEITPTILGRLANIFFKPSQLLITLELKSGIKKQYRIISGMIKSGFLISPLIENTAEFGMLYGKNYFLDGKLVKSIKIAPSTSKSMLWNNEYSITFSQIETNSLIDVSKIYNFDGFNEKLSVVKVSKARKCDGSIDVVNNTSPLAEKLVVSGLLKVNGWLAVSTEEALLPEAVYVVLTDQKGKHIYLDTHVTPRPDVGANFKKPELNNSGYATLADISGLEGEYTLGLAMKHSNLLEICQQFNIPTTIKK